MVDSSILDDPRIARGYAAQFTRRRAFIAAGARPIGWKVGFGAPAVMKRLGLSAPLLGFLTERGLVRSGAAIPLVGWTRPAAEPEIAVHIGRDVHGTPDEDAARKAIAALSPAIELADLDAPPDDVEGALAGNIFHRHVVIGPTERRAGANLAGLTARIIRNGSEVAVTAELEANTGSIVAIVQHVAGVLAHFEEHLRAGDFIIAGSIVPPFFLEERDTEFAIDLQPVGAVSVRFPQK